MQRISSWTDLVAALGLFRYGTVTGGVAPTPLKAEWLNMVQEELANAILAFLPELDANDPTQLLKAIQASGANYALKATTLAGYGIVNAYTKPETDWLLSQKANNAITLAGYGIGDAYTKTATDTLLAGKANNATTLGGYGIADAYTKAATDTLLAAKQDKNTALMEATGWRLDKATGFLEQWGSGVCPADTTTAPINFPTPFAEVYNCFGNKINTNSVDGDGNAAGAFATSATQYQLFNDTNLMAVTVHWRAIGKAPGY
jgi:phage-related tail fiber protein